MPTAIDTRVERTLPLVRKLALRLARKLPPSIEVDDLVQEGSIGLMQAAKRFDPKAHDNFALYAQRRIMGAMLDSVRRRHWVAATLAPIEEGQGMPEEGDLEQETQEREITGVVRQACGQLRSDKRRAIHLVYSEGMTQHSAAREMGVSVERFRTLHRESVDLMRYKLRKLRPAA
jgi:RNA polymerase sigma factor for flagellar operon FliA